MKQIPLGNGMHAMIDEEDYARVSQHTWYALKLRDTTYAISYLDGRNVQYEYLHRFLMNPPDGMQVDHRDRNGLNCTWVNMRICTAQQNQRNSRALNNTTGYRGVEETRYGKFSARILVDVGVRLNLGNFNTAQEAARAYDTAAVEYHGEFATLNFPEEHPDGNDPETYSRRTALRIAACV
jgi:hypothetical protein